MKTKFYYFTTTLMIVVIFLFFSCNKNEDLVKEEEKIEKISVKKPYELIEDLAIALAKVFDESKETRDLIKGEALKRFNHDYDVLFMLIKDTDLGNGNTLEDQLNKYISEEDLLVLLKEYPTLTLFVPSLPENSFSAEKWNTDFEIPKVAIRTYNNVVPVYNAMGESFTLLSDEIPGFPIVVLKENERVVVRDNNLKNIGVTFRSRSTGVDFQFIDPNFDNITENLKFRNSNILIFDYEKYQKGIDSYDYFKNNTEGWQRDYVYYNLTKDIDRGPFDLRFKESVVGFEMINNGLGNVNKISDQNDEPKLDGYWHLKPLVTTPGGSGRSFYTPWTDGEFEFRIKVYHGAKNFGGSEVITSFRVQPEDLFKVITNTSPRNSDIYQVVGVENLYVNPNISLFEWDLNYYSYSAKIVVEEVDQSQTQKVTQTSTSEFATNFGYDVTFGDTVKQGIKFGSSTKETHSFTYEITTMLDNDNLGEIIINFGDEIVMNKDYISKNTRKGEKIIPNFNKKYETGYYRIYIAPKFFD